MEITRAVELTQIYPDIVKIISVGNEARVRWQTSYYVQPKVILDWVNHLQQLKLENKLPKDLWITSSDDFISWGGGDPSYHHPDLEKLVAAVDYISMHTIPFTIPITILNFGLQKSSLKINTTKYKGLTVLWYRLKNLPLPNTITSRVT